jgi:hypothetical protein
VRRLLGDCCECGEQKQLHHHHPKDKAGDRICRGCYNRLRCPVRACSECGERKLFRRLHPIDTAKGRVCDGCYKRLTGPVGPCVECGVEFPTKSGHRVNGYSVLAPALAVELDIVGRRTSRSLTKM